MSGNGKQMILVVTDAFMKYVQLVAIPNKEAATVAKGIFEHWICRFGVPIEIVTDQGKEFTGQMSEDLFEMLQISHLKTTAYHPQCNGEAKRANQTIIKYLNSFTDDSTLDWEDYLYPLMFYYNTSFHRSIKATPFFLTFGMEAQQPSLLTPDMRWKICGESMTDELIHPLLAARDTAHCNNKIVSEKTEQDANKKTMPHNFVISQLVLLNEKSFLHKNTKLATNWSGPHKNVRLKHDNNVELKLKTGRSLVTHANWLKPYFVPLPVKTSAEFPKSEMSKKYGKLSLQDSNLQPAGPDDFDDDESPPPLHQHWLRGERKPRNFELFDQISPPPVSRQSSPSIPPTRQPSQNFQPPPPPSRQRLFALPTRQASFARNDDAQIINFSDADFAASTFQAPPPQRGRGRPRKNLLPTVAEPTDSSATPPAEGGGEGQSPDAAAETGQENIQVNFIEEQGDWVMVLRRKSKQKLPKTTFLYWNKEMRGNFKAWGDPYKCISTDQNFPVPVAAPLPAVAPPALPPPFVPLPIILPPPPVNVVLPPAFVP